jgi:hypothetical protein
MKGHILLLRNVFLSWHMNCALLIKVSMRKDHRDEPSDSNKQKGSAIKPVMSSENLEGSEEIGKKHAKDEGKLSDNVKEKDPNRRNTNKDNGGGARY